MRTLCLLVLVGCGTEEELPGPPPAPFASGQVIRARLLTAPGFSTLFGWHDTRLDYDCSLAGMAREPVCARFDTNRFSEDSCSLPVTDSNAAPFVVRTPGGYYQVGAPYQGTTYLATGSTCSLDTLTAGFGLERVTLDAIAMARFVYIDSYRAAGYTATATVDGSNFIELIDAPLVDENEDTSGRLRGVFQVAANELRMLKLDGAVPAIHDTMLDHACHPARDGAGAIRCYPSSDIAAPRQFTDDPTCMAAPTLAATSSGVFTSEANPDADELAVVDLAVRCMQPLAGSWFEAGTCQPVTEPLVGCVPIDPSTLEQLTFAIE